MRFFERTTRSVTLTTVGRVFASSAEQLFDDLDVALLGIRDVSTSRLGHVTIACVPSVAYYFLPSVISTYRRRFSRIRVKLRAGDDNRPVLPERAKHLAHARTMPARLEFLGFFKVAAEQEEFQECSPATGKTISAIFRTIDVYSLSIH